MLAGVEDMAIDAEHLATRILRAFDRPVRAGEEPVSVHLSIGIADTGQSGSDADRLIRDAQVAVDQAKSAGKVRLGFFDPSMAAEILRRHDLKEELSKAL